MKKILVVDDHPLIRRSMIMLIKDQYPEIVIFESGTECGALEIVHKENPDMVILDLELNQGEGLSVLQQMRHEGKATPVLVVSMHQKPDRINQALREGANGYIFKGDGAENLLAAIQSILDGDKYMSESIPSIVVQGLQAGKLSQDASPLPALSKREQEIFDLIGQSLTPKEVAYQLHISSHTIDTHIERILEKLHFGIPPPTHLHGCTRTNQEAIAIGLTMYFLLPIFLIMENIFTIACRENHHKKWWLS